MGAGAASATTGAGAAAAGSGVWFAGADSVSLVACGPVTAGGSCAPVWSGDELEVVPAILWLPTAAGCACGCTGGSTVAVDVLTGLGRDWLMCDKASGVGGGAGIATDLSLDISVFDCGAGVTTAEGRPAAGLAGSAVPGVVVKLLDCDEPGAVALPLDAVGTAAFWVGTFPVPGDPNPGKTVPS